VYVTNEWKRISIVINLQKVVDGATSKNIITNLIVQNLVDFGGLSEIDIVNKLVCFEANGSTILQGVRNGVTI
jgi:mannitol/fructose-specific phosphotransferase system IIA component (Ntr-type)